MRGIWTALVTPFQENGELDLENFRKLLHRQASSGIAGVVTGGSTGESVCLSLEEKKTLVSVAVEVLKGEAKSAGTQVYASTGSSSAKDTLEFSVWADQQGVDGVMVVTPYYNKPSQAGLYEHFQAVANAVSCEMMIYNVPSRTGVSVTADTVSRLASHPRITTIKEASGSIPFASQVIYQAQKAQVSIDLMSGDDIIYLPLASAGATGVVSVASNLFPKGMVAMQKAVDAGQFQEAVRLHQFYYPLFRDLFIESNPTPLKYALSVLGLCRNYVRSPLVPPLAENRAKIENSMKECQLL